MGTTPYERFGAQYAIYTIHWPTKLLVGRDTVVGEPNCWPWEDYCTNGTWLAIERWLSEKGLH